MSFNTSNNIFDPETGELLYLGKGAYFPFQITNAGSTRLAWCEIGEYTKIAHSVMQILGTQIGSRYMLRDFGSNLGALVFEPLNISLINRVESEIMTSLRKWEARLEDLTVDASIDNANNRLIVKVSFSIAGTVGEGSLVFPFYRERGIGEDEITFSVQAT